MHTFYILIYSNHPIAEGETGCSPYLIEREQADHSMLASLNRLMAVLALCGLLMPPAQAEPDSVGDLAPPRTPEQARNELRERGIPYTQLAFLERVKKGDLFAVGLFRDAGIDLHAPTDDHGWTGLMGAAKEGRLEAEFLVEHGADIHAQDYPRWHLPEGALARLGKGSIRERDRTIAYSPDGTRLAVATDLGIWLYDVRIPNEATYAWNLESDAGYFWSRWVYEIPTYNEVLLLPGRGVSSVAFSPDGNTLASGGGEILLWDVATGQRKATLKGVSPVSFSPDGNTLASGGRDSTVVLWDVDSRQQKAALKGHTEWVSSVSFSPDGNILAASNWDSTVVLWDVNSRQQKATLALPSLWDRALSVSFSPDGNTLASGTTKGNIVLWDVDSRQQKAAFGHWDGVSSVSFSPDGNTLASGSDDLQVRLWDVATGQLKAVLQGHWAQVSSVSFSPDGNTLASSSLDGNVVLWDVDSRQPKSTFSGHTWWANSLAFLPDGNTLVSGSWDKTIRLWDVATGQLKATRLTGHRDGVLSVVLLPDGNTLASVSRDGMVRLWDVDSDQRPTILKGQHFSVVSFSPDGNTLASGGRDSTVVLWDVDSRQQKAALALPSLWDRALSVSFSPDGNTLASGTTKGDIALWDVDSRQRKVVLTGHRKEVNSLAFSPDGNMLASGSRDSTVVLWDMDSRQRKVVLKGHTGSVSSVSFSPDGNTLASGSGEILLWDVDSGQRKAVLKGGGSVSFSPDGKTLASSSWDGTILLWDVSLHITPPTSSAIELSPPLPTQTALLANFPNPFNPDTYIPYQLHAPASVRLTIYDIRGGLVREIDVGDRAAGQYLTSTRAAHWDGRDQRGQHVASGVYLYRLQAGPVAHVRKMLLVK